MSAGLRDGRLFNGDLIPGHGVLLSMHLYGNISGAAIMK